MHLLWRIFPAFYVQKKIDCQVFERGNADQYVSNVGPFPNSCNFSNFNPKLESFVGINLEIICKFNLPPARCD